jgi:hypothetical protein
VQLFLKNPEGNKNKQTKEMRQKETIHHTGYHALHMQFPTAAQCTRFPNGVPYHLNAEIT